MGTVFKIDTSGFEGISKNEDMVVHLQLNGYSINEIIDHSDPGYNEKMNLVGTKLRSLDTKDSYTYLEEMYDDYLVYNVSGPDSRKMYKQSYKIEGGKIEFVGEPIEVHKKVDYVVNSNNPFVRTKPVKNKEEQKMSKKKCTPCIEEKVDGLIANNQGFTEDDREMLLTFSETQLDKLLVKKEKKIEVNEEDEEDDVEPIVNTNKTKEKKETPVVETLSEEDKADLAWAKQQRLAKRTKLMKGIQANTSKEQWPDAELSKMSEDQLVRIYNSVKQEEDEDEEGDFSLNNAGHRDIETDEEVEPLYPGGMDVKPAEKKEGGK